MKNKIIILVLALSLGLGACTLSPDEYAAIQSEATSPSEPTANFEETPRRPTLSPEVLSPSPMTERSAELGKEAAATESQAIANSAINPLSGLPVSNPENLLLPPALVSITTFPPNARPQAGLSYSPMVYELYIGKGMTRYLALFYGDYPQAAAPDPNGELPQATIGPIRSGRLTYEHLRLLFNGFIVMASASSNVSSEMRDFVNVYGDDQSDPNSAMMPVEELETISRETDTKFDPAALDVMRFDVQAPEGGKLAKSLWIIYSYKNQVFWRYNRADGSYHRWQDNADGATFIEATDRLTGEPLTYENVVVLFAEHRVVNGNLRDVNLLYVERGKALLFRDEQMYEIYWTTASEEYEQTTGKLRPIRFTDAQGDPFPLKPGQTWIALVPRGDVYWETVDSEIYNRLMSGRSKGSGFWALDFYLP